MTQAHTLPTARDGDLRAAGEALVKTAWALDSRMISASAQAASDSRLVTPEFGITAGDLRLLMRAIHRTVAAIAASPPPPAQDPVPALGLPAGEVEGLRAVLVRQVVSALLLDWQEDKKGSLPREYEDGYETALRHVAYRAGKTVLAPPVRVGRNSADPVHVLAPPASAADGEGLRELLERFRDFVIDRVSVWDISKGACNHHNPIWAEIAEAIKLPTTPPPVPPTREAGLDRAKNWNLGAELSRPVSTWSFDAPTPGETPGQDEVEARPSQSVAFRAWFDEPAQDGIHIAHAASAFDAGYRQALASLRSTQADTGGERQTPAPAGDAVEALQQLIDARTLDLSNSHNDLSYSTKDMNRFAIEQLRAALAAIEQGPGAGQAETFATIQQWCEETFGPITPQRMVERAGEEFEELRAEPDSAEGAADVVICLARTPGLWGAVERKMAKNRKRTWRLCGDGTGYHVPAAPATAASEGDAA